MTRPATLGEGENPEDYDDHGEAVDILRCCGEDRPKEFVPLTVRASTQPYVTVKDHVDAVHPWLMQRRDDVLKAKNVWEIKPPRKDAELRLVFGRPTDIIVEAHATPEMYREYNAKIAAIVSSNTVSVELDNIIFDCRRAGTFHDATHLRA
jgi:hypothetical protein